MNNSSINKENRQIELITILLPAALCFGIAEGMRKLGLIKSGDMKLKDISHA